VIEELEVAENSTTLSSANTPEKSNSKICQGEFRRNDYEELKHEDIEVMLSQALSLQQVQLDIDRLLSEEGEQSEEESLQSVDLNTKAVSLWSESFKRKTRLSIFEKITKENHIDK